MNIQINQMSGRQQLFAIIFLLLVIFLSFAMLATDKTTTMIVSGVICVVMYLSQPVWLPENHGRAKVRMFSLSIALATVLSYGFWQQAVEKLIVAIVQQYAPQWSDNLTILQLPPLIALGFILLTIIVVNFYNRDRTAMGVHPNRLEDDIPDLTYAQKVDVVADALLENLKTINRQTKWNSRQYTPLDAQVETVKNNRRVKGFDDLLSAIKKSKDRVFLVLGEPGSGKSVALRKLCQDMLGEVQKTNKFPIYVNLKEWTPQSGHAWHEDNPPTVKDLEEFIKDNLTSRDISLSRFFNRTLQDGTTYFDRLYDTGHLYFVLDSFDEIPAVLSEAEGSELIKHLSTIIYTFLKGANPNRSQGILSSRIFRQPTVHFDASTRLEIRAFTEDKIQQAFGNYNIHDEAIIRRLFATRQDLIPVASNPFSAALIAEYFFSKEGSFPKNQSDMYENYILETLKDCKSELAKRSLSISEVIETTTEIAHQMFEKYGLEAPLDQLQTDLPEMQINNVVGVLTFGRVGRLGIGNENLFSFTHRRFAEYFAVRKMLSTGSLVDMNSIPSDSKLRDALVLYCEVAEEAQARIIANFCWEILQNATSLQDTKAIHALRFLNDAFRGRLHLLDHFRADLGQFIAEQVDIEGHFLSVKLAVEATGILESSDIDEIVLNAFRLNVPPINEVSLKSCRNLSNISESLEQSVMRYIDTYEGMEFLTRRHNLKFSLSLSNAFYRIERFVDLKTWSLQAFMFIVLLYTILFPSVSFIVYVSSILGLMVASIYILLLGEVGLLGKPLPSKGSIIVNDAFNLSPLTEWFRIVGSLIIVGLFSLRIEAPARFFELVIQTSFFRLDLFSFSHMQIDNIFRVTSILLIISNVPIHLVYRYWLIVKKVDLQKLLSHALVSIKRNGLHALKEIIEVVIFGIILMLAVFVFLELLPTFVQIGFLIVGVVLGIGLKIWEGVTRWRRASKIVEEISWELCSNREYIYNKYLEIEHERYQRKFVDLLDINVRLVSGSWPDETIFTVSIR